MLNMGAAPSLKTLLTFLYVNHCILTVMLVDVEVFWDDRSCQLLDPKTEALDSETSSHLTGIIYPTQVKFKLDTFPALLFSELVKSVAQGDMLHTKQDKFCHVRVLNSHTGVVLVCFSMSAFIVNKNGINLTVD